MKRRAASPAAGAGQRGSPPSGPASASVFAVAYGGGPLIVEENEAFSRYLTGDDLGAVLCEAGLKWSKGHPTSRSDIIVLGDTQRCHSLKKPDTHAGSGLDKATHAQVGAAGAGTRSKPLSVLTLAELMARFPSVAAAAQRWTRFCDWASVQGTRKFRAPGKARNLSVLQECVPTPARSAPPSFFPTPA